MKKIIIKLCLVLMLFLSAIFINNNSFADVSINVDAFYSWSIMKQQVMTISGKKVLSLKLKNPDQKKVLKTVMVFVDMPSGIILAYQYEIDGIKRTFYLSGDKYIEVMTNKFKI